MSSAILKFAVMRHDCLDSTNTEAWRLIDQGLGQGTVVTACTQTAGRGQRHRQWRSPLGGLYLSLILEPQIPASRAAEITIWSVWGIAQVLTDYIPHLHIKWLNDLVVQGQKLGGILTETRISGQLISHGVVGVGINWLNAVPEVGTNLVDRVSNIENLENLEALVLAGMAKGYELWQSQGIAAILPQYIQLLDRNIIQIGDRQGNIIALTATGDLVVQWEQNFGITHLKPGSISLGYGTIPLSKS